MTMQKQSIKLQKKRYFSVAFKKEKVNQILTKKITICELSKLYDIRQQIIYRWIKKFSPQKEDDVKINFEMENEAQKTLFYKEQNSELERIIGKKQIELDFLNRLIEIASDELGFDLKKKFSTQPSNGSDKTPIKENSK